MHSVFKFCFILIFFLSCNQGLKGVQEHSHGQFLIDSKRYLEAIDYLERDPKSNNDLLIDAYIGASGFELLPFLIKISRVPFNTERGNLHLLEYLNKLTHHFKSMNNLNTSYIIKAMNRLNSKTSQHQERNNFKKGLLNLYTIFSYFKLMTSSFVPKIIFDEENQKVLLLTDEENFLLLSYYETIIKNSFEAFLNLRASYPTIKKFFFNLDRLLLQKFGFTIEDIIQKIKETPIDQVINELLITYPEILKTIYMLIDGECSKSNIRNFLINVEQKIKNDERYSNLLVIIDTLFDELDDFEESYCE